MKTISEILGHSNIDITLKVYTHTSSKAKQKAVEKFERKLKKENITYNTKYKGNVCCIRKLTQKLDFIGTIKEVAEYIGDSPNNICAIINFTKENSVYDIVPEIEGITHKNGVHMGG